MQYVDYRQRVIKLYERSFQPYQNTKDELAVEYIRQKFQGLSLD